MTAKCTRLSRIIFRRKKMTIYPTPSAISPQHPPIHPNSRARPHSTSSEFPGPSSASVQDSGTSGADHDHRQSTDAGDHHHHHQRNRNRHFSNQNSAACDPPNRAPRVMKLVQDFECSTNHHFTAAHFPATARSVANPTRPFTNGKQRASLSNNNQQRTTNHTAAAQLTRSLPSVGPFNPPVPFKFQLSTESALARSQHWSANDPYIGLKKSNSRKITLDDILLDTTPPQPTTLSHSSNFLSMDGLDTSAAKENSRKSRFVPLPPLHSSIRLASPRSATTSANSTGSSPISLIDDANTPNFARPTQSWLKHRSGKSFSKTDQSFLSERQRSMSWVNVNHNSSPTSTREASPKRFENKLSNRCSVYWSSSNPNMGKEPDADHPNGHYFIEKRWKESLRRNPEQKQPSNLMSISDIRFGRVGGQPTTNNKQISLSRVFGDHSSKAKSMDSVAFRKSRRKSPVPPDYTVHRTSRGHGQPLARYSTLDTVCEEKVMSSSNRGRALTETQSSSDRHDSVELIRPPEVLITRTPPAEEPAGFTNEPGDRNTIDCNYSMMMLGRHVSEANLLEQCRNLGLLGTRSDNFMLKEQQPLRYKRESWLRRYSSQNINNNNQNQNQTAPPPPQVELEPDREPTFERRNVVARKNVSLDSEYTIVDLLGRGKFGEVKRCIEKKSGKELAVKIVPVRSEVERKDVYNEIEVMNSLQNPRLLQLYDAIDSKREIALIMELISGGELFERVIDEDFILTEMLCELYMRQICEGIAFMHRENFLHLDMKPENILCVNRDGHRIKIIDFGLARRFKPGDCLKILFGTPEFVAPEVIAYEQIGQGTDMWSIGVICFVLLSGLSPFMGENDAETYNNIARVAFDFEDEAFDDISTEAKDFISKLLVAKKENRLSAEQCLQHEWLTRHQTRTDRSGSTNTTSSTDEPKIDTTKLKRFVIRRRWQKAVNALLALKRMGMSL